MGLKPGAQAGGRQDVIARLATTLTGILLMIYGLIAAFSPLPLGAPLVILGLIMIAAANPAARPFILALRRRWRWFDFLVRKAARHSPKRYHETFEETDPANHPAPQPAHSQAPAKKDG
ncbi:MAG: hypothetical protein CMI63_12005 [Parvularcula sp.]|uniref:hypothetical protein n=1 Tax=Hyphococcus sp. TaxID=2038636 RepID=UPI000C5B64C6|nr:hypothetical protein [Parvularcula sp.]